MFIGHLPAAYLLTRSMLTGVTVNQDQGRRYRLLLACGLFAGILPDLDLFYFYFIDQRQHLHHAYWTHIPSFWLALFGASSVIGFLLRSRALMLALWILAANILLHLFLDTISGGIRWLYPFSSQDFVFVQVPARYSWWVLNFIFHWTFALEIVVLFAAMVAYKYSRRQRALPELGGGTHR